VLLKWSSVESVSVCRLLGQDETVGVLEVSEECERGRVSERVVRGLGRRIIKGAVMNAIRCHAAMRHAHALALFQHHLPCLPQLACLPPQLQPMLILLLGVYQL